MEAAITWLSEAPTPTAVAMAPQGGIKAARALREVGDHKDRDNAEYAGRHSIQDLDRDQLTRVVGEGGENSANRQDSECDEQQRLSTPCPRLPPPPGSQQRDDKLRGDHARRHEHHRVPALPLGQHLAQQRQHRGVRKMEPHGADQEDHQRAVPEKDPDAFRLAAVPAFVPAPRPLVIDLVGADEEQG